MVSIQQAIEEAALKRIRARRAKSGDSDTPAVKEAASAQTSVRVATFADFGRVFVMSQRLGQGSDSLENWHRLWRNNPALTDDRGPRAIGWVLENGGNIVGFLGSVPLLYEYEGRTLAAAATCRFAVEPAFRALSHLLVTSFFRQKEIDLFLNTTATVSAGRMMTALKANPLPQSDYDIILYWVLNPRRFTQTVLRRVGLNPRLATPGSALTSLALRSDIVLRGRNPQNHTGKNSVIDVDISEMGEEFESLWLQKKQESNRLFAVRTRAILHWHFVAPGTTRVTRVLACFVGTRLNGYLILRHDMESRDGIRRTIIADMLVLEDDPQVIEQLMAAAYRSAKSAGSDVLEVMGFPGNVRQTLAKWKPYSRKYPACPFFYKVRDRALQETFQREDTWYACAYDGDTTLWP